MIYQVLARMKGTRAVPMAVGVLGVVGFFYFSRWSHLSTVSWLLDEHGAVFVFLDHRYFSIGNSPSAGALRQDGIFPGIFQHQSKPDVR